MILYCTLFTLAYQTLQAIVVHIAPQENALINLNNHGLKDPLDNCQSNQYYDCTILIYNDSSTQTNITDVVAILFNNQADTTRSV
jgi:hypothetical protein